MELLFAVGPLHAGFGVLYHDALVFEGGADEVDFVVGFGGFGFGVEAQRQLQELLGVGAEFFGKAQNVSYNLPVRGHGGGQGGGRGFGQRGRVGGQGIELAEQVEEAGDGAGRVQVVVEAYEEVGGEGG